MEKVVSSQLQAKKHLENVVSSQLQARKHLEKELSEIEARKRHSEVRRLKQIRDLGVDLSKIQATSRGLDKVIFELSTRHREQRRGSLPPLKDRVGASHFLEHSRIPLSKRRLSCIAAISPTTVGNFEYPSSDLFRRENAVIKKNNQLPPISTGSSSPSESSEEIQKNVNVGPEMPVHSGIAPAKDRPCTEQMEAHVFSLAKRRASVKHHQSTSDDNADNNSVDVNKNSESRYVDEEGSSPIHKILDSELNLIFSDAKRSNRRSSEPELRSIFIRDMHDMSLSDVPSFLYPGGEDSEKLRKSIQRNLPSDIVAETDEIETEIDTNGNQITYVNIDRSTLTQPPAKLTSISESDYDGDPNGDLTATDICNLGTGCKEGLETMNDVHQSKDKRSFKLARHRRKSDGDVLLLDNARRFSLEDRYQPGKSNKLGCVAPSPSSRMRYNCSTISQARQDMKDCRYLRGYDPPEINEPDEVVKFVFGHRNKD